MKLEKYRFESNAASHIGKREQNQDAHRICDDLGMFVVCDGMGGAEGGEVASQLAAAAIVDFFSESAEDVDRTWSNVPRELLTFAERQLAVAIDEADRRVKAEQRGSNRCMGTTVVAAYRDEDQLVIAHVGDSRAYRLRDGELTRVTCDHSLYQDLIAAGSDTQVSEREFAYRNVITRALGTPSAHPDVQRMDLRDGDVYILCTDGLVEQLTDEALAHLARETAPAELSQALVDAAVGADCKDNVTVVVLCCESA